MATDRIYPRRRPLYAMNEEEKTVKKVLLIVLALLFVCAVLAEDAFVPEGAEKFVGDWQAEETFIIMDWEEEHFRVLIIQGREDGQSEWDYSCLYDEETGALKSLPYGVRREIVFDDNGEFVSSDEVYEDGEAYFFLDEEDRLTWVDEKDGAGEGLVFERLPAFEPLFSDMTEALSSEGFTGLEGSSDGFYVAVVEVDGVYTRVVAELDETALMLEEAIYEAEDLSAAAAAYEEYVKTLPVTYLEEIVQQPLDEEDLAALAGMKIGELEEEGFEALSYGDGGDGFVVTMALGMYDYDFTVTEEVDIEALWDSETDYAALTVGSAAFSGLSPNVTDLDYLPDGSYYDSVLDTGEFGDSFDFIGALLEAVQSGEVDLETLEATLKESMPDQAEEIMGYLNMFSQLYGDLPASVIPGEDAGD